MTIQETFSQRVLLSSIRQLINGYPDPKNLPPHAPWDWLVRRALQRLQWIFPPRISDPWPWRIVNPPGPGPEPAWDQVELNPQPLPPKLFFAAIAQEVIDRATLIQETANALTSPGEGEGIIIIGGYVSKFADEFCGNGFRLNWPYPLPRPWWFNGEVGGLDLVVAGVQFQRAASETFDEQLQQVFADAGAKLTTAGLARL
jgi:hypothetical protein